MLTGRSTDGPNLHGVVFGIEFGREMGNVNALIQLTYSGRTGTGHAFLLTALAAEEGKTRTDTWVRSRTLLIYSDPEDPARYGHTITAQDHGDYRVLSARVADIAPKIHDWIWKSLAPSDASPATLAELEAAVCRVQESARTLDAAASAFQHLSSEAVRENDRALIAGRLTAHTNEPLPEQDLRVSSPDVRARLYAVRALSAGDPRFLAALSAVTAARGQAQAAIDSGKERFGFFNGIAAYTAPEVPWKDVRRLAVQFMNVAEDVRLTEENTVESLPHALGITETAVTARPSVIVEQSNQQASVTRERILREVHWSVKGIPRREYVSELVEVSPETGLHRVQSVAKPAYIQGPGGIAQVFRHLPATQASTF
jgi:hypothetical protein